MNWGRKDRRAGIGRSSACKRCNPAPSLVSFDGDDLPGCACLVDCGAADCSGREVDYQAPLSYPPKMPPKSPDSKRGENLKPPPYKGPRGKAGD